MVSIKKILLVVGLLAFLGVGIFVLASGRIISGYYLARIEVFASHQLLHMREALFPNPPSAFAGTLVRKRVLSGETANFAVIGDYGLAGKPEADVANLVLGWKPDFIIALGDNNYDTGASATIDINIGEYYHSYIYPYTGTYGPGAKTNKFFPVLGNHDWISTGAQPYENYFTLPGNKRYYDVVQGPVHFFMLDSDPNEPDGNSANSTQALWLKNAMAASTSQWNIVVFHHAPYSSGLHGSTVAMQWPFRAWGADAVLAGHDHTYERLTEDGLPYFVDGISGSTIYEFGDPLPGSQVRYNADFGAMRVRASDQLLNFEFINRSGTVIDTFTLGG